MTIAEVECRVYNNCAGQLEVEFNGTLVTDRELPGLNDKRLYNITDTSNCTTGIGVGFTSKKFWFVASQPGTYLVNCTYSVSTSTCAFRETVINIKKATVCSESVFQTTPSSTDCRPTGTNCSLCADDKSSAPEQQSYFLIILVCTLLTGVINRFRLFPFIN